MVVRAAVVLGGGAALVILGVLGLGWWTHGRFIQSTNDAYLRADQVTVAPKVQGYVEDVMVADNQDVVAGQPLVRIDTRSYRASLNQQMANIDAKEADISASKSQIAQQTFSVDQARQELAGAQTNETYTALEAARYRTLSDQGVETRERAAQAANEHDKARVAARADADALKVAEHQVITLTAQYGQAKAQLAAAQAQVETAKINMADGLIRASISGRIGDRAVRRGQFVQPGTRLMSVVPVAHVYLVANFKETQIGRMCAGQPAKVKVDALPGVELNAVLDSFSPGTGSEFALLPSENATGNFTKVVQRVPVRFRLKASEATSRLLLPGLSATVSVDTNGANGATP
jgi:membrane fusion protein (multidrug efflux system)